MKVLKGLLTIIFALSTSEVFANFDKFSKKSYEEYEIEKAVIIYGVNWGRQWGCAGVDNAQLQSLIFAPVDSVSDGLDGKNWVLTNPSKLLAKNNSHSYAIILSPGEYELIGFDIKISNSSKEIGHIKGSKYLFENGLFVGGTFYVNAGEIIYIGDFGLDCAGDQPIPWRYYIEKEDFQSFTDGFRKKYKFIGNKQINYRLFQTDKFGL